MNIQNIYIQDTEEQERALEVGYFGDVLYLAVGTFTSEFEKRTFDATKGGPTQIAVPVSDLMNAISALILAQGRDDLVRDLGSAADIRPVRLS